MFLKKNNKLSRNYPTWRLGMTSRLVGFLKQAKNRVSDWSLWGKAIAC